MKGILLGIVHVLLFLMFYLLDMLPESRFLLAGCHVIAFFIITIIIARSYFSSGYTSFLKSVSYFFLYLSVSSILSLTFDYTFNNYLDKGYKYILAEQRIEQINDRRERNGVGAYETLDSEKVEKKVSLEASGKNLLYSSILNIILALSISAIGALFKKSNN